MSAHASTVIVGGGMAGARLVQRLRQFGFQDKTTVVCDEPHFGYNRVLLPAYLSDDAVQSGMLLGTDREDTTVIQTSSSAVSVDIGNRTVTSTTGELNFDRLVFATGSNVPKPDCLTKDFDNVLTLRSLADADAIRQLAANTSKVVVIGGGLLGLETASALAKQGIKVSVVHRNACILNRQLNSGASQTLIRQLTSHGLSFLLERQVTHVQAQGNVISHIVLDNDVRVETDLVILATGTRPNVAIARAAGIDCKNGIVVNDQMQTSETSVYAIGECAEFQNSTCALVAPVYEQADVLADVLTGGTRRYRPVDEHVRLKVDGVALYSAGDVNAKGYESVIESDSTTLYRRLTFKDDQLLSAIFLGDTRGSANIQKYLNKPIINSKHREQLLFGSLGE